MPQPQYYQQSSQPQLWVPTQVMEQKLKETRTIFINLIGVVILLVGGGMFLLGHYVADNAWHSWYQSNCIAYPFLLLDPNDHIACTLPTP